MALDTAKATVTLRGLTHKFDMAVQAAAPFYPNLCTIVPSTGKDEQYGWIGSLPGVREWLGDRVFHELRAANFVLENKLWEDSLQIEKTDLADDRMGLYNMAFPQLGEEAALHPDQLLFETIIGAGAQACFDSQYFFDTDHSWGDSGTQSNKLTYAAATGTTPTVDEFKAAYRAAVAALLGFKNDNGKPFYRPTIGRLSDLTLLVPLALRDIAIDAIESNILANSTNVVIDKPNIVCSAFYTDSASFDLYYTGGRVKPFVFQARDPISRQMKGLDDAETKFVKFMTQARYNVGLLAWFFAVRTTFT